MKDSGFTVPADKVGRFAANYGRSAAGLKCIDEPAKSKYLKPAGLVSGGGGMVGTIRDYMRFLLMVDGLGTLGTVKVLSPESVNPMVSALVTFVREDLAAKKVKGLPTLSGYGRVQLEKTWLAA